MFWKMTVSISKDMYQTSGPTMIIGRLLGLFPIIVQKDGKQLILRASTLCLLYSFLFGITMVYLTYAGLLGDILIENEKSVRVKMQSDMYVTFIDITAVLLVVVFRIFLTPFKYSTFCKYVECLNEVDAIIPPTDSKAARNVSVFMMSSILTATFAISSIDTFMYFKTVGETSGKLFILKSYSAFYVDYHIMLASQYQFWFLVYSILRRMKALNKKLSIDNFASVVRNKDDEPFNKNKLLLAGTSKNKNFKSKSNCIFKLMKVYAKLCDSVRFLNHLYGLTCLVTLMGILWHLIEAPYLLIVEVVGNRKNAQYISMMTAWCFIHIGRLLLIAQPCYACLREVEKTTDLVCKLLSLTDIGEDLKIQLQDFLLVLSHRKFEFTASGLATMDRTLVTSVVGAITTYLVILLQFAKPEQ